MLSSPRKNTIHCYKYGSISIQPMRFKKYSILVLSLVQNGFSENSPVADGKSLLTGIGGQQSVSTVT
jgi:hypothetical protein